MQLSQDVRDIMTRQDMSQTCHMRHIIMPDDQTLLKNNFAHVTTFQMQHFNPIESKWVVAAPMRSV